MANFPWLSSILQTTKRQPLVSRAGEMSQACAETLIRVAHLGSAACRTAKRGVFTILRARALVVRLLLVMQTSAFQALFLSLAALRERCEEFPGGEVATAVAISHSWDETKQMLREPPQTEQSRRSTQKVARNILVQRSFLHACGIIHESGGKKVEHSRSESVIIPPVELYGKTAGHVISGLRKGLLLPMFSPEKVSELSRCVTAVVLCFLGDAASTNRRMLKHLAGMTHLPSWPTNVLTDVGQACLLHQVHRIKVQVVDIHATISLMYCMSKLVRAGAIMHLVANYIGKTVSERCRRSVGPPPPGRNPVQTALDFVHKLGAPHHLHFGARGVSKHRLVRDVEEVLRMDNSGENSPDGDIVHHCWNGRGGPCCASLEEARLKMTSAYMNLFVCHGMPVATLSCWTHIQIV